jgi:hypothetical protein
MKFMLMMNMPPGRKSYEIYDWSKEDIEAHGRFMGRLNKSLREEGVFVSVEGLHSPDRARLVRAGKGGAPEVTDGPFAETKEFLAGFWIVDVETPEQAYAIAARASTAPGPGGKPLNMAIEVREVMSGLPLE